MNRINKILLVTLVAAACTAFSAAAQNRVTVTQNKYDHKGDSVYVELLIGVHNLQVPAQAFVLLTPAIRQGDVSADLPAVMINGRNRHRAYRRLTALHRGPVGVGQVINAGGHEAPRTYLYSAAVLYEPWMKEADFVVREEQCACNGPRVQMNVNLMADRMQELNPPAAPVYKEVPLHFVVSFKEPNPEPIKIRSESGKAYLDFVVGRAELKSDFKNNAAELFKIGEMIRRIKDDPATTITGITIDGYASPEGAYVSNMTLSGRRATALKDYIRTVYGLQENLLRVMGRGEDWATLETLVAASGAGYREQALAIIRSADDFDGRDRKLAALQGGAPYKEMMAILFPQLRRTDYELQYTVIPFTIEEGKRTLEVNPSLLSLNEMFLIAQTYPAGSAPFQRVFDIAAKTYPGSDIANFNAAANALAAHDIAAAQKYLSQVVHRDAAFENNTGVLAAFQGDYEQADRHFAKAVAGGNAEAVENLAQIEKIKKN